MIRISGAKLNEKLLVNRVEKAVYARFNQEDIFAVDVAVVDENTIREFNRENRQVDAVTDVLSFPYLEKPDLPVTKEDFSDGDFDGKRVLLGSLMICRKRAEEQAAEYGHSYAREISFLTCHGLLHLLGFDHVDPEDEKVMRALQDDVMNSVEQYR